MRIKLIALSYQIYFQISSFPLNTENPEPLKLVATRTYFTTSTYYTTMIEKSSTITKTKTVINSKVVTDTYSGGQFDYLPAPVQSTIVPLIEQDPEEKYLSVGPNIYGLVKTFYATYTYYTANPQGLSDQSLEVITQVSTSFFSTSKLPSSIIVSTPSKEIVPTASLQLDKDSLLSIKQSFILEQGQISGDIQPSLTASYVQENGSPVPQTQLAEDGSSSQVDASSSSLLPVQTTSPEQGLLDDLPETDITIPISVVPVTKPSENSDSTELLESVNPSKPLSTYDASSTAAAPSTSEDEATTEQTMDAPDGSNVFANGLLGAVVGGISSAFTPQNSNGANVDLGPVLDAVATLLRGPIRSAIANRRNTAYANDRSSVDPPSVTSTKVVNIPKIARIHNTEIPNFIPVGEAGNSRYPSQAGYDFIPLNGVQSYSKQALPRIDTSSEIEADPNYRRQNQPQHIIHADNPQYIDVLNKYEHSYLYNKHQKNSLKIKIVPGGEGTQYQQNQYPSNPNPNHQASAVQKPPPPRPQGEPNHRREHGPTTGERAPPPQRPNQPPPRQNNVYRGAVNPVSQSNPKFNIPSQNNRNTNIQSNAKLPQLNNAPLTSYVPLAPKSRPPPPPNTYVPQPTNIPPAPNTYVPPPPSTNSYVPRSTNPPPKKYNSIPSNPYQFNPNEKYGDSSTAVTENRDVITSFNSGFNPATRINYDGNNRQTADQNERKVENGESAEVVNSNNANTYNPSTKPPGNEYSKSDSSIKTSSGNVNLDPRTSSKTPKKRKDEEYQKPVTGEKNYVAGFLPNQPTPTQYGPRQTATSAKVQGYGNTDQKSPTNIGHNTPNSENTNIQDTHGKHKEDPSNNGFEIINLNSSEQATHVYSELEPSFTVSSSLVVGSNPGSYPTFTSVESSKNKYDYEGWLTDGDPLKNLPPLRPTATLDITAVEHEAPKTVTYSNEWQTPLDLPTASFVPQNPPPPNSNFEREWTAYEKNANPNVAVLRPTKSSSLIVSEKDAPKTVTYASEWFANTVKPSQVSRQYSEITRRPDLGDARIDVVSPYDDELPTKRVRSTTPKPAFKRPTSGATTQGYNSKEQEQQRDPLNQQQKQINVKKQQQQQTISQQNQGSYQQQSQQTQQQPDNTQGLTQQQPELSQQQIKDRQNLDGIPTIETDVNDPYLTIQTYLTSTLNPTVDNENVRSSSRSTTSSLPQDGQIYDPYEEYQANYPVYDNFDYEETTAGTSSSNTVFNFEPTRPSRDSVVGGLGSAIKVTSDGYVGYKNVNNYPTSPANYPDDLINEASTESVQKIVKIETLSDGYNGFIERVTTRPVRPDQESYLDNKSPSTFQEPDDNPLPVIDWANSDVNNHGSQYFTELIDQGRKENKKRKYDATVSRSSTASSKGEPTFINIDNTLSTKGFESSVTPPSKTTPAIVTEPTQDISESIIQPQKSTQLTPEFGSVKNSTYFNVGLANGLFIDRDSSRYKDTRTPDSKPGVIIDSEGSLDTDFNRTLEGEAEGNLNSTNYKNEGGTYKQDEEDNRNQGRGSART